MSESAFADPAGATLLIIATELKDNPINVTKEANLIAKLYDQGKCAIYYNKTPDEICERINVKGSQISKVHFVGHGITGRNRYELAVVDKDGKHITSQIFYNTIIHKKQRSLELIFLNACNTIQIGEELSKEENAQVVICWDSKCTGRGATAFAEWFYHSLAHTTQSVEQQYHHAFNAAKERVSGVYNMDLDPMGDASYLTSIPEGLKLNKKPCLVALLENCAQAEQEDLLQRITDAHKQVAGSHGEDEILFYPIVDEADPLSTQIRARSGLVQAQGPQVLVLDIPDQGGYHVADMTSTGITADAVSAFLGDFKEKGTNRKQLCKTDAQSKRLCGRVRILPLHARKWMPVRLYSCSFRPLTEGVLLAEGPTYHANADHWPGTTQIAGRLFLCCNVIANRTVRLPQLHFFASSSCSSLPSVVRHVLCCESCMNRARAVLSQRHRRGSSACAVLCPR
jgi:hypothetical protein